MKRTLVLLLVALAIAGCGLERLANDTASALAALESMQASVLDAVVRKDPAPLVALFADDAVVHGADGTAFEGKDAIAARIAALMPRVQAYSLTSRHLEASGDLAYDDATFNLTLAGVDGGSSQALIGTTVLVLRRQPDRTWRIIQAGSWLGPHPVMDHDMPGGMPR